MYFYFFQKDASEIKLPGECSPKPENSEEKEPVADIKNEVRLEDIEPPATPESFKGETSSDSVKTESPKISKPVLGKIHAHKRLMAFANQFKPLPKVNKFKKPEKNKNKGNKTLTNFYFCFKIFITN